MSESFSVSSRLTITTNAEAVLEKLIEAFGELDSRIRSSEEVLSAFGRNAGKLGEETGSLKEAFAEIKLPQGLSQNLESLANTVKSFAAESKSAAQAWREIADASREVRKPGNPPGGNGGGGGRNRREEEEGGILGTAGERASAKFWNSEFDAQSKFQQKLMADEQKAVLQEIAQREKDEKERNNLERNLLEDEQKAVIRQISERQKLEDERASQERRLMAEEQKVVQASIEAREKQTTAILQEIARNNKKDMQPGETYGPAPIHQAIFGPPGAMQQAKAEDTEYDRQQKKVQQELAAREKEIEKNRKLLFGETHHDVAMTGMALQMGTQPIIGLAEQGIEAKWNLEHEMALISGHGSIAQNKEDPNMLEHIRETVKKTARSTPGITQVEVAEVYQDLMTAFGDPNEALEQLPVFSKLVNTLQLGDLHRGGKGSMDQALALARYIENDGGALDPRTGKYDTTKNPETGMTKFEELAQKAISISYGTRFKVNPSDYLALIKTARESGMMLNDHAKYEELPYFMQSMNPSKLGTALFSNMQVLLGNRATPKTEDVLGYYNMYGGRKLATDKQGHPKRDRSGNLQYEWDQDTLVERDMLKNDPFTWIHDVLGKHIVDKKGLDPTKAESKEEAQKAIEEVMLSMVEAAQRSTIAGLYAESYRNHEIAQKEGRNVAAQNPDMQKHMQENDPMAQIKNFHAAENELLVAIGDLLSGPALKILKDLIKQLGELADMIDHHKEMAKWLAEIGVGVALFGNSLGTLFIGLSFLKPVIGTFEALAKALIPFRVGGAALAGLQGLETGVGALAAKSGVPAAAAVLPASVPILTAILGGIGGYLGAKKSGTDIATHAEQGETPMMIDDFGNAIGYKSVTKPKPESLVAPSPSDKGPIPVVVTNQISGHDIARGVSSYQADKSNRPPSGYTGTDLKMDPLGAFYGMVNAPF